MTQALLDAKVDAIFNVTFGTDLQKFVREGNTRGLFKDRPVVSLLSGEPEYLDTLKDETPTGWLVTGYPWQDINTPEHKAFREAYLAKYKDHPRLGSVVGYATMKSIAAMLKKVELDRRGEDAGRNEEPDGRKPFGKITLARRTTSRRWVPTLAAWRKGRQGCDGQLALRGRQGRTADRRGSEAAALGDSSTFQTPSRTAKKCVRLRACSGADPGPLGRDRPGLRKIAG